MQVRNFRCVVIQKGYILGHMTGEIINTGNSPTAVVNLKPQALRPEEHFHISSIDPANLQAVAGWGDITHVYNVPNEVASSAEAPIAENYSPAQTKLPKANWFADLFTKSAKIA